jgi:hypothetical protein
MATEHVDEPGSCTNPELRTAPDVRAGLATDHKSVYLRNMATGAPIGHATLTRSSGRA